MARNEYGLDPIDLDNYITGHWGEDQFKADEPDPDDLSGDEADRPMTDAEQEREQAGEERQPTQLGNLGIRGESVSQEPDDSHKQRQIDNHG